MINRLIRLFLHMPLLALLVAVCLVVFGWQAFVDNPKDAIPDIAENQVIVFSEWMGRSPKDVDEQVTYPLTVALQGVPRVREIRATSGFGWSIIYVVFHDDVDFYWARSRVLERLSVAQTALPAGVAPQLGPDATALGQVFWYTVENGWYSPERPGLRFHEDGTLTAASRAALRSGGAGAGEAAAPEADPAEAPAAGLSPTEIERRLENAQPFTDPISGAPLVFSDLPLDRLRSIQDYDVKLALQTVPGVSEVASIGGYVRQYQIDVNPEALRAFGIPLSRIVAAVRQSNIDVGAKVIEEGGTEILIRGVGFLGGGARSAGTRAEREAAALRDIEHIVVSAADGTPIYVSQLGTITTGPDFRRGALDKMGAEAVGGSVIMRFGENPLTVIEGVRERITSIESGLPPGVRINAAYDRSTLIHETMGTLREALTQELIISVVIVLLFLLHFRSSLVVAAGLPLSVLFAFICMEALELPSNLMSLAGIAIAIGELVDMGIIMTENIYQHLTDRRGEFQRVETDARGRMRTRLDRARRLDVIEEAATEVGPAIVTAVATTVISFIPVFFLEGQAAKLFTPLAWTKTFCMVGAVLLALTIVPPLAARLLRERQISRGATALWAAAAALLLGGGWYLLPRWRPSVAEFTVPIERYIELSPALASLVVGLIAFALTWIVLRERIRPIEQNPVSRLIRWMYEPVLRWVLHHKLLFLTVPVILVIWGLAIWLGWGTLLAPLTLFSEWTGVDLIGWSAARWLHLAIGVILGLLILPLLLDTVLALFRRGRAWVERNGRFYPAAKWLLGAAAALLIAWGLEAAAFADRNAATVGALVGRPPTAAAEAGAGPFSGFKPLAALAADRTGIGQEFMPPLDEGDFLYMPSVLPAGSLNTVLEVMQKQDVQFAQIPEVNMVLGKLGRIESALDPAPVGMLETMILLKPRREWPLIQDPEYPDIERRRTMDEVWEEIKAAGRFPGVLPSVQLQPIRTRIEMLSTGLNAKIGIKIYGDNYERCEALAVEIEQLLRRALVDEAGIAEAVNAIRISGKPYLEFIIDREAIARYGVNIQDVQDVIEVAVGGKNLTTTYEGLDRYPVRVRYQRELRDEVVDLERILVPTADGAQIPISQVAEIQRVVGPMSVRREGAKYVGYVTMNNVGIDETSLVRRGQALIEQAVIDGRLELPEGYFLKWAGSYERNLRARQRLMILIPLVLVINFLLIYMQFKRLPLTLVIFLSIPVGFAGGFIMLDWWPEIQDWLFRAGIMDRPFPGDAMYLTVAVWIGFIALFGLVVDDGIVMATYLDQLFSRSRIRRYEEIEERVVLAGLRRIRPCLMTTATTLVALAPVLLITGRGSEVMAPMAVPLFGGMLVALISIFIVPTCYCAFKQIKWRLGVPDRDFER